VIDFVIPGSGVWPARERRFQRQDRGRFFGGGGGGATGAGLSSAQTGFGSNRAGVMSMIAPFWAGISFTATVSGR
jgi:hypothetical protein